MRTIILSALAVAALSGSAMAGLSSVQSTAINAASLTMPVDNAWTGDYGTRGAKTPDQDWGYVTIQGGSNGDKIWLDEVWTGAMTTNVIGLDLFGGRDAMTDTTINISKDVQNVTGFTWTGFQMNLSTLSGNINVLSSSSADFASTIVTNNNTNNVSMTYSLGSVANGDTANFLFSFKIPISSVWSFTIEQTPTPTPGAFGLAGVAGLVALRRRR